MGFVLGLDRTSAVAGAILISTHPMFALLFSWLGGRERPTRMGVIGLLVGFGGVVVFLGGWSNLGAARVGDLLALGAAAAFGAYGAINQGLSPRYTSAELMAYTLGVGGTLIVLVSVPAMAAQDWSAVGAETWLIVLFSIFGPVYLAYALWNWAIHKRGIARTVVWGFLVPIVGRRDGGPVAARDGAARGGRGLRPGGGRPGRLAARSPPRCGPLRAPRLG